ncbi:MAG: hypothetical protein LW814_04905 [Anabaena sp. CoA2_C59]|jgi:hypothetical protein|nr:hypothetical protein [Anabaena sp. CoA2_C59]MDJ0507145.1 hypothetical protein [Nostocales cyanobacterium LE14-WE12]
MANKQHPNKEIQAALEYAVTKGWSVKVGGSHAWGKIYCPYNDSECRCGIFCINSISSTPRNPTNHAKQIRKVVDKCIRLEEKQPTTSNEG